MALRPDASILETLWPSGLRRWLKAPFRKGVGSNPTGVILGMSLRLRVCARVCILSCSQINVEPGWHADRRYMHAHQHEQCMVSENDSEGIRTPAGRAQWISSPSP